MISIDLGELELYDDVKQQFEYVKVGVVNFEYSLKAVYDWEGIWRKPFLKNEKRTEAEMISFYKLMADRDFDEKAITYEVSETLSKYIGDPCTATTFGSVLGQNENTSRSAKVYSAEEIYALMAEAHIPIEFESRNLNRLLTILRIISNRNQPKKKMKSQDILKQNADLNAKRKAMLKTKG